MRCAVFGCNMDDQAKGYKKGDVMFFRFPSEPTIRKAWQNACGRKDTINPVTARVCSKHFQVSDYARNLKHELLGYKPKNCRLIKLDAVPNQNLPRKPTSYDTGSGNTSNRCQLIENRNRSKLVEVLLKEENIKTENIHDDSCGSFLEGNGVIDKCDEEVLTKDAGTNTEVDKRDEIIVELRTKIAQLESENQMMKNLFKKQRINQL